MKASFTADGTIGPFYATDPGNKFQQQNWTAWVSGTFGGGSLAIETSPDDRTVDPGSVRWFTTTTPNLTFTSDGVLWFQLRFRQLRFVLTGSTNPSLVAEVV